MSTYVGDKSPQQDEKMDEEVVQHPIGVQRSDMPRRIDRRVCFELEDCICALFARERVPHEHVTQIIEESHLFDIWRTLPRDMTTLMCHVVSALMLIRSLQARTQSGSSPQLDDVPDDAHHDSSLAHA